MGREDRGEVEERIRRRSVRGRWSRRYWEREGEESFNKIVSMREG